MGKSWLWKIWGGQGPGWTEQKELRTELGMISV